MNKIDIDYQVLLKDILENGTRKETRNGQTISVFGRQIRHKMSEGFPLLTTKKVYFKGVVTELLWFLRGETNISYLLENDVHIWDGDAYKAFCKERSDRHNHVVKTNPGTTFPAWEETVSKDEFIDKMVNEAGFSEKWGDLGPIYGKQWRKWEKYGYRGVQNGALDCGMITMDEYEKQMSIDQIANAINLLKTDPDSRRNIVSAWNVAEIDSMVLPPCHYSFQVYTRELTWEEQVQWVMKNTDVELENVYIVEEIAKPSTPKLAISLMWNQRSVDTPLGLPFNIASYALLLEIVGKMVNMVPDEIIGNLGDTHIYLNQIDGVKEQLNREPYELPKLVHMKTGEFYKAMSEDLSLLSHLDFGDFLLENYQSRPAIKIPLSN